jgi:hypothetical protein
MIIVVHAQPNPAQNGQWQVAVGPAEGGPPEVMISVLQAAQQWLAQQVSGPQIHLPNGQVHVAPPSTPPQAGPPQ